MVARLIAWGATVALAVAVGFLAGRVMPVETSAPMTLPPVLPGMDTEPCIVALSGSGATVEVTGVDADVGCAYLESLTFDPKRWYRVASYVNGPTVCARAGIGRTYTIRDQGTFLINGNAWCRWIDDGSVVLP